MKLADHPTVRRIRERGGVEVADSGSAEPLDAKWLRDLALNCGADDAGLIEIGRAALDEQRNEILRFFPRTRTLLSFVCRMNREPIRSPARSISNLEFHGTYDHANETARKIVAELERRGIKAVNPSTGFPMEMDRFPGRIWVVSHKPVAVAAGLGRMGIHRNVIHPQFGNFITLGTVLIDAEATEYGQPIDYNPCLECKLCVAACPVGAISPEGDFNFGNCMTHNYKEFMSGFGTWIDDIADSASARDYRSRVSAPETVSMWQSLAFGPNYKAAYCLAVCPAGDEVIGPYLANQASFRNDVVKPLTEKEENIYVVPGSDAADYVSRRFPKKRVRHVHSGIRPQTIDGFLFGLKLIFQPGKAKGLRATYHFTFTGREEREATVVIEDGTLRVEQGHEGTADLRVTADSDTWLGFLARERSLIWALVRRQIRLKGSPRLLLAFGRCFPS